MRAIERHQARVFAALAFVYGRAEQDPMDRPAPDEDTFGDDDDDFDDPDDDDDDEDDAGDWEVAP